MPGRLANIHLNRKGRAQAEALADALAKVPIAAIYSSPLERARETAEPIAARIGLKVQIRPDLADTDIGVWQGHRSRGKHRLDLWHLIQQEPSRVRFPGGESFLEVQSRLVGAFDAILQSHQAKDIPAVVFHADPIKLIVAHFLGLPLDNFQRLVIDTGSITLLQVGGSGARLIWLNQKPPFQFPLVKVK